MVVKTEVRGINTYESIMVYNYINCRLMHMFSFQGSHESISTVMRSVEVSSIMGCTKTKRSLIWDPEP